MRAVLFAFSALGLLACAPASAHDYTLGALRIVHPWTRATLGGAQVAGGYLRIENKGSAADRLTGASVDFAGRAEIHEMKTEHGVMKMRALPEGLEIKPGASAEFKPGSYHVMFLDLKQPLRQGERVKAQLNFEKAGTVDVEFVVESAGVKESSDHVH